MAIKKTLSISMELEERLQKYTDENKFAKVNLSKILQENLDEFLKSRGY